VVFKHPLERSRIMVKRLVGMPGEDLRIEYGDVWTRASETEPWRILRRPRAVQREMWRELRRDPRGADWCVVRGGKEWLVAEDAITARGDGAARFRPTTVRSATSTRTAIPSSLLQIAHDAAAGATRSAIVRLEGELRRARGHHGGDLRAHRGPARVRVHAARPGARRRTPRSACASATRRASSERVERGARYRLPADARVAFALENLDDRLALELDGAAAPTRDRAQRPPGGLAHAGGRGRRRGLLRLRVARDVYYDPPDRRAFWNVTIPPGHYVMMGDNTQDSADSRLWKAPDLRVPDGDGSRGHGLGQGNYRESREPLLATLPGGAPAIRFRDRWGDIHWFRQDAKVSQSLPGTSRWSRAS
jgi:hypothetical protein